METGQRITEKKSKIDSLKNKILSIQVSLSGLSFCVLDTQTNMFTYYKHFRFERKLNPGEVLDKLQHQFNTQKDLQQDFKSVTVIYNNELSALVPKSIFNENYLADYLKFNSKILRTDFITYDEILANDSINVYVPYVNINNHLYERFGEFEFKHFSTVLLDTVLGIEKHNDNQKMYAHINDTHFEIIVLNNGDLQLYNTFEYASKEDFIYYILFTAEQLQLNPESFPLILIGDISEEDELFKAAFTYVRNVSILESRSNYSFTDIDTESLLHNFILINSL